MARFQEAIDDYRYLRNRGFPEKASLKLVGDRYRLSGAERNSLFRGVCEHQTSAGRRAKLLRPQDIAGGALGMDWYNILITVESFLKGFPVFVADDGVVRDPSGVHSSYKTSPITRRAVGEIIRALERLHPKSVAVFLDSPVSHSAEMATRLRQELAENASFAFSVNLEHSPDYRLKSFTGIVASSDSVILDSADRAFDVARYTLEIAFGHMPGSIRDLKFSIP